MAGFVLEMYGTIVVVVMALLFVALGRSKQQRLPPGPKPWPVVGSLHLLGSSPHQSLARLASKYGALMSMRLGSTLVVVASSPDMARLFLQTFDQTYASRPCSAASSYIFNRSDIAFAPYDPHWKLLRRVCTSAVFHHKRIGLYLPIYLQETHDLLIRLLHHSSSSPTQPIVLRPLLRAAANNIVSRLVIGKKYPDISPTGSATNLSAINEEILLLMSAPNVGDYIHCLAWLDLQGLEKRMKDVARTVKVFMGEIIDGRRAARAAAGDDIRSNDEHQSLLDVLLDMEASNEVQQPDVYITDKDISVVILDLLVAGTETPAQSVEWAMAELMANPSCLEKVEEELDSVVGRERLAEEGDIAKLTYLQAVVKETLRLHPPGPLLLPREGMRACKVAGYELPAKTCVYVNVWAIGRDKATWEEVEAFRPERFVGSEVDASGRFFQLLPFGAGRRRCIGWELGLLLVHLFLARLIQCFQWHLPAHIHQVDMTELSGRSVSLLLANPLALLASPRLPNLLECKDMDMQTI